MGPMRDFTGLAHSIHPQPILGFEWDFVRDLTGFALVLADPTVPRVAHTNPVRDLTGPTNWDGYERLGYFLM